MIPDQALRQGRVLQSARDPCGSCKNIVDLEIYGSVVIFVSGLFSSQNRFIFINCFITTATPATEYVRTLSFKDNICPINLDWKSINHRVEDINNSWPSVSTFVLMIVAMFTPLIQGKRSDQAKFPLWSSKPKYIGPIGAQRKGLQRTVHHIYSSQKRC